MRGEIKSNSHFFFFFAQLIVQMVVLQAEDFYILVER